MFDKPKKENRSLSASPILPTKKTKKKSNKL